jgi:hypothetical protein
VPAASSAAVPRHEQDVVGMLLSIAESGVPAKHKPKIVGVLLPTVPTMPPKQRRASVVRATYAPAQATAERPRFIEDSYFADTGNGTMERVGVGAVQFGTSFIPVAGPFISAGIGISSCITWERKSLLKQAYAEDRQLNRRWTKENLEINQKSAGDYVTPRCLPVIGGFIRAVEAPTPVEAFFAIASIPLDLAPFVKIPSSVTTPLSIASMAKKGHDLLQANGGNQDLLPPNMRYQARK